MIVLQGNLSKNFTQAEYHRGDAKVGMTKETIVFIRVLQAFRNWLKASMIVISWGRTKAENAAVGGIPNSNHLLPRACALDWHLTNRTIDKTLFIKYAKKWASLCKSAGVLGECGLYNWGMHIGIQNSAQAKANGGRFVHWDSRTGKQINNPFTELRGL